MDWKNISFDWNRTRAFVVTAESGSFSAAARAMGSTQPTISRQVAALEEELQVTLFERMGTRLQLTTSGAELLAHARPMAEAAMRVSMAAAGHASSVEGLVTITAGEAFAAHLLPPILTALRQDYPGIQIELCASNQLRDLHRREADIAIRNVRPQHPDLIGRRLRDATAGIYASPGYLARMGPFETTADLARAAFLAFDSTESMLEGMLALGIPASREQFSIITGNHLVQWQLCLAGAGMCFMMCEIGDREPGVLRVLPDLEMPLQTWLVCHRELHTSLRLRIVFDRLAAAFRPPQ